MMESENCLIRVRVRELARALETMQACVACNIKVKIVGVPRDVGDVAIVPYATDGSRFDAQPMDCDGNGDYRGKVAGACFPTAGSAKYEIVGVDGDGETVSLGWGTILIAAFGSGSEAGGGALRRITAIPDAKGVMHDIIAVKDDYGNWTWEIGD